MTSQEKKLWKSFLNDVKALGQVSKGSLGQFWRKCGLPGCKQCKDNGKGHLSYKLTFKQNGKSCTRFVGPSQVEAMREALENGKKLTDMMLKYGLEYLRIMKHPKGDE